MSLTIYFENLLGLVNFHEDPYILEDRIENILNHTSFVLESIDCMENDIVDMDIFVPSQCKTVIISSEYLRGDKRWLINELEVMSL